MVSARWVRHICLLLATVSLSLFMAGCGGGGGSGSSATLTGIQVKSATSALPVGVQMSFSATGTYSNNTTADLTGLVTWSSSDTGRASINSAGTATGIAPGTTTIKATYIGISATSPLTVDTSTVQNIAVSPANTEISVGQKTPFTAIGTFSNSHTYDLTKQVVWSSSDTAKATIDSIGTAAGVAPTSLPHVTITAASGGVSGTAILRVDTATLTGIVVSPVNPTIAVNGTQPFTAMGTFSDGEQYPLTDQVDWSSSDTTKATIITIPGDKNRGTATGLAAGTTTITATAAAMGNVKGSTTLAVQAVPAPTDIPNPPDYNATYLQIMIVNRTSVPDKDVHVSALAYEMSLTSPTQLGRTWLSGGANWQDPVFKTFQANGSNRAEFTPSSYDVTLDKLPTVNGYPVVKIPFLKPGSTNTSMGGSGRLYITLNNPAVIVPTQQYRDSGGGVLVPTGVWSLAEPSPDNRQAGAQNRWDFMEFNNATQPIEAGKYMSFVNTTNVDFFSLGMTILGRSYNGELTHRFGLDLNRANPVTGVLDALWQLQGDYPKGQMYVSESDHSQGKLRFLSPKMTFNGSTMLRDAIQTGFEYYRLNQLNYTEKSSGIHFVATFDGTSLVFDSPLPTKPDVTGPKIRISLPATYDIFTGNDGSLKTIIGQDNENNVKKFISAYLNRGIFTNWNTDRDHWYTTGSFNQYSKILHDRFIGTLTYGFPYDDVPGMDGTKNEPSINNCGSLTLVITDR